MLGGRADSTHAAGVLFVFSLGRPRPPKLPAGTWLLWGCGPFLHHDLPALVCNDVVRLFREWVGGDSNRRVRSAYDFRAVNDYAPLRREISMSDASTSASAFPLSIVITNDQVRVTCHKSHPPASTCTNMWCARSKASAACWDSWLQTVFPRKRERAS